jgi:hypothetical protein
VVVVAAVETVVIGEAGLPPPLVTAVVVPLRAKHQHEGSIIAEANKKNVS